MLFGFLFQFFLLLLNEAIKVTGILLNESYFLCPSCTTPHHLFGPPDAFQATANRLLIDVLAELPLVPGVSAGGDAGVPYGLMSEEQRKGDGFGGIEWIEKMRVAAEKVWLAIK